MKKQDFSAANKVAIAGGLLGLLPFWALAFADLWATGELLVFSQGYLANYAALILTFIGAIWWGIALAAPQDLLTKAARRLLFGWSLTPCLLAWFLLMFSAQVALVGIASLLLLQLLLDYIFLWRAQLIAPWFWRLRLVLTTGAVPALVLAVLSI